VAATGPQLIIFRSLNRWKTDSVIYSYFKTRAAVVWVGSLAPLTGAME